MIYYDNSATTKPYKEVVDSFVKISTDYFGNPSSLHNVGGAAEQLVMKARRQTAELLRVKPQEIIFTSGGTESNNLAIKGVALQYRKKGNHIITSSIEHASVRESYHQLEEMGFDVTTVPVDQYGRVQAKDIEAAICDRTILVSIMHVNNEVGSIQPLEEIGQVLKEHSKVLFHVDNVQGIGKVPLDLQECGIDLCSYSGHKFHGLKGTGLLYIREGIRLTPLLSGGNQEYKYRSGTENVAGIVALAKAMRISLKKMEECMDTIVAIKSKLYEELQEIPGVLLHTPAVQSAPHILNFSVEGLKAEVIVHALEEQGIYLSTTSACSSKKKSGSSTLLSMGVSDSLIGSALRLSLSYENTLEETTIFMNAIKNVVDHLKEVMK